MSLIAFDVDGTLIESYFRKGAEKTVENYALVTVLPGRRERIAELAQAGYSFALVTNQAGVALGYQPLVDVWRKMGLVIAELGCFHGAPVSVHVCMHHPEARLPEWHQDPCPRRKPEPGMLWEAMDAHGIDHMEIQGKSTQTLGATFVGDMASDAEAAKRAGMAYVDAEVFFGA